MTRNIKYGLAYLLPPIAGLVLLLGYKNQNDAEDRAQLGQSIALGAALWILGIVVRIISGIFRVLWITQWIAGLFGAVYGIAWILVILLAVFYFTGKTYKLPVLYDVGVSIGKVGN